MVTLCNQCFFITKHNSRRHRREYHRWRLRLFFCRTQKVSKVVKSVFCMHNEIKLVTKSCFHFHLQITHGTFHSHLYHCTCYAKYFYLCKMSLNFHEPNKLLFGYNTVLSFFLALNKAAPMWTIFPQLRLVQDVHPTVGVSVKRMWIVPEMLCVVSMVVPTPAKEAEVVLEVTVEDKSYSFKDS